MNRLARKTDSENKRRSRLRTKQPLTELIGMTDVYREVKLQIKNMKKVLGETSYDSNPNSKTVNDFVSTLSRIKVRGRMDKIKDLSPVIKELAKFLTEPKMKDAHSEIMRVIGAVGDSFAVSYLLEVSAFGQEGSERAVELLGLLRALNPKTFDEEFTKALSEGASGRQVWGAMFTFDKLGMEDNYAVMSALLLLKTRDEINDKLRNETTKVLLNSMLKRMYRRV